MNGAKLKAIFERCKDYTIAWWFGITFALAFYDPLIAGLFGFITYAAFFIWCMIVFPQRGPGAHSNTDGP
ncbi:hypothetical protein SAMCCGM7_Ch3423 [Sinorhizobium americanum CCGM7]|uniref:hypothetical protein n=1 Tax=Sinorhizobium americanum TaxID=194963 RepID=UPI0004D58EC4|nr:hypothetical protein [Sinorhizobium americanum]APG86139.1 hypothetical protein SAMCCGM7_Ch3423 [Sinorhizobium americanum CCGM7]